MATYTKEEDERISALIEKIKEMLNAAIIRRDTKGGRKRDRNEARGSVDTCVDILQEIESDWNLGFEVIETWEATSDFTGIKTSWEASRTRLGGPIKFSGKIVGQLNGQIAGE